MKTFKLRLEQALSSGAALAMLSLPACSSETNNGSNGGSGGADKASGGEAGGGAGGVPSAGEGEEEAGANAAGESRQQLAPYPESALGCSGPALDGGYYGQCCATALCYTPEDSSDCVAPSEAPAKLGQSYGSGKCLCDTAIQGPYAKNPAHQPTTAGTCCYVVSSIECEGRPLLVDGAPVISALTQRRDWLSPGVLEFVA